MVEAAEVVETLHPVLVVELLFVSLVPDSSETLKKVDVVLKDLVLKDMDDEMVSGVLDSFLNRCVPHSLRRIGINRPFWWCPLTRW